MIKISECCHHCGITFTTRSGAMFKHIKTHGYNTIDEYIIYMVKLKKFADDLKITRMTLWNWMYAGKIQFHKIGSMNYIDQETYDKFLGIKESKEESVVIYARVSSTVNKTNLETQSLRLQQYCTQLKVIRLVK